MLSRRLPSILLLLSAILLPGAVARATELPLVLHEDQRIVLMGNGLGSRML
jgi:hypothetical protein